MKHFDFYSLLAFVVMTAGIANASDKEALEKLGGKIVMQKGVMTSLRIDCINWTDTEFQLVAKQTSLKRLSLNGKTLNDQTLKLLTSLKNLESFQTNVAQISDEGFKLFQQFPKLKNVSLFHHARDLEGFNGSGLAHLTSITTLTFAGAKTGDVAMQAVGKLTQLESYSQWHNLETAAGMKHLQKLKNLKALRIGQRLHDWKPSPKPPSFDAETIKIITQLELLESLTIMEARLSFADLIELKKLSNLKKFSIRTVAISEADIAKLKQELPGVEIKWEPLSQENEKKMLTDKLKI